MQPDAVLEFSAGFENFERRATRFRFAGDRIWFRQRFFGLER
jgi:hypothetical protein